MPHFALTVLYSQITVCEKGLENPFNDWSKMHHNQGFSWRPGSVSFRTLDSGLVTIDYDIGGFKGIIPGCQRAISVPFEVRESTDVEIATVSESRDIVLQPGQYQLIFQTGRERSETWIHFTFVPNGNQQSQILVRDNDLDPPEKLLMVASPA